MVDAQRKQESTIDPGEVSRFAAMAKEWWAPHGKMRPLHKLNPVRIAFIRDLACDIFDRSPRKLDCLRGLRILDIGCGGGILSEPLARLGGEVVGIDPAEENVEVAKVHAEQSALEIDYRATSAETGRAIRAARTRSASSSGGCSVSFRLIVPAQGRSLTTPVDERPFCIGQGHFSPSSKVMRL